MKEGTKDYMKVGRKERKERSQERKEGSEGR
jgi:hypothetical protein